MKLIYYYCSKEIVMPFIEEKLKGQYCFVLIVVKMFI